MLAFAKRKKGLLITAAILLVGGIFIFKAGGNGETETVSPVLGDLVRIVKISGKVIPKESVNLGFELSGTVASVSREVGSVVNKGSLLARLDASSISAEVSKAEAELNLALAALDKLEGAGTFEAQIANAKRAVIQSILNARAVSDDAVYKKADQLFINVHSGFPEIYGDLSKNVNLRDSINTTRRKMDDLFETWRTLTAGLNLSNYTEEKLAKSREYLYDIAVYVAQVSQAANLFEESNWLSQTTIDEYKTVMAAAETALNTATQSLITSEENFKNLLLEVPVQVARVESARAALSNTRSELSKTSLSSPIDGVVSKQDAKVGQTVAANTEVISVISRELEIESFVPEVSIAGVKVGNGALVTLDAYGKSVSFGAQVIQIDPAETIRDGVSTYKVRLAFLDQTEAIRSGMTANINIETARKPSAVLIPERTVIVEGSESFVYILGPDGEETKTPVEVGERDSSGNIELLSSLPEGTKLVTNPKSE
ncbi:MAG: efflux RND transporter periplasmic adaptor subunit [Minisyncoccia bacterium]